MKYDVTMTCIYNGFVQVEANSEKEAMEKANETLTPELLNQFPSEVGSDSVSFSFGEVTVDYAEPE